MSSIQSTKTATKIKVRAFLSLLFAMVFFSGLLASPEWYGVFDFTTLNGTFGHVVGGLPGLLDQPVTGSTFRGSGGSGAMEGFLFAFGLIPVVMFALGMINVFEHYGALQAAQKLLTPLLRPLLGIPGATGLALIGSLQSTDVGASLTRNMYERELLTAKERDIFAMFQFSAGAMFTNFFSSGAILFTLLAVDDMPALPTSMGLCLIIIFSMKIVGVNLLRLALRDGSKKGAVRDNNRNGEQC